MVSPVKTAQPTDQAGTRAVSPVKSHPGCPLLNSPKNLLSFTTGWYGRSGYTTGALYSSDRPSQSSPSSSPPRRHFRSGISPSLVLPEEIEMSEKRFTKGLDRRATAEAWSLFLLRSIASRSGVGMDVSMRPGRGGGGGNTDESASLCFLVLSLAGVWVGGLLCFLASFALLRLLLLLPVDREAVLDVLLLDDCNVLDVFEDLEDPEDLEDFEVDVEATEPREELLSSR